jgi:hypothetical protein
MTRLLPSLDEPVSDALAIFLDSNECSPLDQAAVDWLLQSGVSPHNIGSPWALRAARVRFLSNSQYLPDQPGDFVFIFAVMDARGICDAAAWCPASGAVGSRLGIANALGQQDAAWDTDLLTSGKLRVRRNPLDWLINYGDGIAIVDPILAAQALAGFDIEAADADHARELDALLRIPPPRSTFHNFSRAAA